VAQHLDDEGWDVVDIQGTIHIIPIDDTQEHGGFLCECNPQFDTHGELVHNSFDGREITVRH
jgi:hypothetical protein